MTVQFDSAVQKGIVIQALTDYKVPLGQATEILAHLEAVVKAEIVPVTPVTPVTPIKVGKKKEGEK